MGSNDEEKQYNLSGLEFGIAGAASGVTTRFLLQPLDVLKIRFQLQITPSRLKDQMKYTSLLQAVRLIIKEEGSSGLWKGHIPAQFLSVIFGAVQFSTYEMLTGYIQSRAPNSYKKYEPLYNIGCGSAAGLAAVVLSFPFDVIRTHLIFQSESKTYRGTIDAARKIYKRDGLYGFRKGMLAACVQTVPMSGLVFCFHGLFTQLWSFLFEEIDTREPVILSTAGSMVTGLLAGLSAKTLVYPWDLMKKRLQIQGFDGKDGCCKEMIVCKNLIQCFKLTIKHEGFLGLYKGFTPSLLKAGATTSIYFTIYDKVCQFLMHTGKR